MKAVRVHQFGEPSVMKLEEVPDPKPAAGQVVVRISAIGINPVETYIRKGIYGPREFPFTPGSDAAGIVEALGPGVTKFKPGERVYIYGSLTGAYAEKALCKESQVYRLPERSSFSQGAAIGVPYGTAYRALFIRGGARAGETVLIHGASGGVGTAATQLARARGLTVIGTGGSEEGKKLVRENGAHIVLDHKSDGYLKYLMDATGGKGVNLIIEMLANVNLGKDLTVLAKNGRVVVVGSRGKVDIDPRETMGRDADIRGMTLMNADEEELRCIHAAIGEGLENGTLKPVVGREFALSEAAEAHEAVMAPGAYGKIVLQV
jgi:NADPH2:quinone reductase